MTGSGTNSTELLNLSSWTWNRRADYPYAPRIWDAPTLAHNHEFYIFGGDSYGFQKKF